MISTYKGPRLNCTESKKMKSPFHALVLFNSVCLCMQATGGPLRGSAVAYCAGIPLLLAAVLLISIQLLIMEILGCLIEFLLKFWACSSLIEFAWLARLWDWVLHGVVHSPSASCPVGCNCVLFCFHVKLSFSKRCHSRWRFCCLQYYSRVLPSLLE